MGLFRDNEASNVNATWLGGKTVGYFISVVEDLNSGFFAPLIRTSVYMYVYIADSIKDALGIGKLLFGGHSSKKLHCSICQNAQCALINDQLPK